MAQFNYVARDRQGKKHTGVIQGDTKKMVHSRLRDRGLRVVDLQPKKETLWSKDIYIGNPVKLADFVIYLRQFSTLIKSGVTIVDSTRILINQTESKVLKKTLAQVEVDLNEGNSLSDALGKHPKVFTPLFINMVHAGEVSGSLEETLEELAEYFERQHETKQKIKSAMTYPVVVGFIALAVIAFLLIYVVPTFVDMFAQFDGELPGITKFVIGSSAWLIGNWWLLLLIIVIIGIGLYAMMQKPDTKYYIDLFLLRIPIFGNLLKKALIARFSRTLSSLLMNSVSILKAVALTEKVVGNEVFSRALGESRYVLERGRSMSEPLDKHWAFPPLVTQMIAVGEQTGTLDHMLGRIADFYESEVETATDSLKSLIEPLMIVVLAVIVGTIVLAIMVPMFELFNNVG
ncbi:type II secretion system F family protein [Salirhabdus salicampi]|uniref:type II secretion system F family protein n=1 Tax=Salirhabdus salicampi TaxID=476102 RepID=UPI0020C3DECE|nr:type II secretion system F family protein [Salirhabdus salicampi]MCP8617935.1 type II secretion system F family protein [Salirhabdus salicampi]